MATAIPARVAERAATKYVEDSNGCYISTYSIGSHGYAQVGWFNADLGREQATTAHRAAWTHHEGPIPGDLTVDHKCRVRPCVRREHLRLLPNGANASDNGQVPVNQTVGRKCGKGHDMVSAEGGRAYCRSCQNERRRARRALGKAN
jgi:hypothetical protein